MYIHIYFEVCVDYNKQFFFCAYVRAIVRARRCCCLLVGCGGEWTSICFFFFLPDTPAFVYQFFATSVWYRSKRFFCVFSVPDARWLMFRRPSVVVNCFLYIILFYFISLWLLLHRCCGRTRTDSTRAPPPSQPLLRVYLWRASSSETASMVSRLWSDVVYLSIYLCSTNNVFTFLIVEVVHSEVCSTMAPITLAGFVHGQKRYVGR